MRRSLMAAVAVAALATPFAVVATAGSAAAAPAAAAASKPVTDFNHDGYADLAVSAYRGAVDGVSGAGYVSIVYGSASGADTAHAKQISRTTAGVPGDPEVDGGFGASTEAADLDGDGYTDLTVNNGSKDVVIWGSANGLTQGSELPGEYVQTLKAGDFNGDGKTDLVANSSSTMEVRYGPFTRDGKPASTSSVENGDDGPKELMVGDVTGDGADDLVTSHDFEEMQYSSRLWKGSKDGLAKTSTATKKFTTNGVIADVDKDGYGDLVAREVDEVSETQVYDAGAVRVIYGSASGFSSRTAKIDQDTAGVPGASEAAEINGPERGDQFGYSVSAGDVTGDGYADIVVGVPGENLGNVADTGAVVLLKGGANGLTGTGAQAFNQDTAAVPGVSEKGDNFGEEVKLTDVNKDGLADLTVGVPQEDGTTKDSGAAWLFRGTKTGLTTTGITSFSPSSLGTPEAGARFGGELA
ncbi:FG-GAP-like repeat-containing protein [Streptomyces durmitorensis]|uniref:FG-GAP-like repeat-containing protein n=1 Tax=Streptomyces durmitorensis TaxID=319947 RepID=A0ABY4PVT2_9ACTN|nr:FG-GAP-like repeat-containing protein [Streptomyces durmitorensis]UQT57960.1 FG-GAP-like repeat-containing protein [Streptomyces durmitorensis]